MRPDEETLRYLYETERLSQQQIAERLKISLKIIAECFKTYGIKRLPKSTLAATPHSRPDYETVYRLYITERLTTRQIGSQYGMSKTEVLRWLKFYDISRRAANSGLLNRGMVEPTKEELEHLIHVEHKGYREIAEMYGVDLTAVPYWLKKHQIERPTIWETRRKGVQIVYPTQEELRQMYLEDGLSLAQIGARYGVSDGPISQLCKEFDIPVRLGGFNGGIRFTCNDGHLVRSTYELRVDNWLHEHGIDHEYEPRLPFGQRYYADFLVNGWYIEIWGVTESTDYAQRKARKLALYRAHQTPLIQLSVGSFSERRKDSWKRCLTQCLTSRNFQIQLTLPQI